MTWYRPEWDEKTTFLEAIATGDVRKVREMLAGGLSVETVESSDREPALQLAASRGQLEVVRELIDRGASVTSRSRYEATLLHVLGAQEKLLPLVPLALERGGDLEATDSWGATPLLVAAGAACIPGARALLAAGANPLARDNDGSTAVFRLVHSIYFVHEGRKNERECLDLLRDLLSLGVDPNAVGWLGHTAATVAAESGFARALRALRKHGARLEQADRRGLTPLQAAAFLGREDAAAVILEAGAPLDLFSAAALGRVGAVRAFLQSEPGLARAVLAPRRTSVLSLAVAFGHEKLVRVLLEAGADPNGENQWTSCLHAAVDHLPDPDIVRLLLEHGANVDAGDGDGNTPLNFASRRDNLELARMFLDAGADPNSTTERGYTPLTFAGGEAMQALLRSRGGR